MSETGPLPSRSVRLLTETLRAIDLKFALVGGVAVALIATPRFTADVDAVVLDIDGRLEWLISEFEKAGYSVRAVDQVAMTKRTRVLTLRDGSGTGIDLMLGLLPFDEELVSKAVLARLGDGTVVPVASPEHLLVMKAIAWRPKDQEDIRQIVAVNPSFDRNYVLETVGEYASLLEVPERVDELQALIMQKPV